MITRSHIPAAIILLSLWFGAELPAQESTQEFAVTVQTGYTTMAIPQTKGLLADAAQFFEQAYAIRPEKLVAFPNNWFVGSSIRLLLQQDLWLDVGVYYTRSRGRLGYRDTHGSLDEDLNLQVVVTKLGLILQLSDEGLVRPFVFAGAGSIFGSLRIDETVQFDQAPEYNEKFSTTISGVMAALEGGAGLQATAGPCDFSFEVSYRFSLKDDDWNQDYSDDFKGWIIGARVSVPFQW